MRLLCSVGVALVLVAGCGTGKPSPRPLAPGATLDMYVVAPTNTPNTKQAIDPETNMPLFLTTPAIISAADVATVQSVVDSSKSPAIAVRLTPAGAKKLAAATAKPAGMQVAIMVNGAVVSTPKVNAPLSTEFRITSGAIQKRRDEMFEALTK